MAFRTAAMPFFDPHARPRFKGGSCSVLFQGSQILGKDSQVPAVAAVCERWHVRPIIPTAPNMQ